ncbi:MAG: hypothetical protein JW722_02560 [Demequinaceae bacterium]|nr:hypothetical protein [Demequinaceae bacterium]
MGKSEAKIATQTASVVVAEGVPRRRRLWMRTAQVLAASALVSATLYLSALSFLWSGRVAELRDTAGDLADQRGEVEDALAVDGRALAQLQAGLDYMHSQFLVSANHSVRADEYALYLSYVGVAMGYCIDASFDVAYYVRMKWNIRPWSMIHAYDDDVREICVDIRGYFTEAVEFIEANLPAPEPAAEVS